MVEVSIKGYLTYLQKRLDKAFMELSTSIDKPDEEDSKIMMYNAAHDMFKTYQSFRELPLFEKDSPIKSTIEITEEQYDAMRKFDEGIGETDPEEGEEPLQETTFDFLAAINRETYARCTYLMDKLRYWLGCYSLTYTFADPLYALLDKTTHNVEEFRNNLQQVREKTTHPLPNETEIIDEILNILKDF